MTKDRAGALYISVVAAMLAIASLLGDSAAEKALQSSIAATNTYAHYQAKTIRQTVLGAAGRNPKEVARYERERPWLLANARAHEKARDLASNSDGWFDMAVAFLQLAIVLATAWMVTESAWLRVVSGAFATAGLLATVCGFFV